MILKIFIDRLIWKVEFFLLVFFFITSVTLKKVMKKNKKAIKFYKIESNIIKHYRGVKLADDFWVYCLIKEIRLM